MTDPLEPEGVDFVPVSAGLVTVRVIAVLIWTLVPALACAVVAVLVTRGSGPGSASCWG
ncbi:hypothetical protein [Actinomyces polynesiensis]|uniref:hypothetical protein n=1 Tax=Actinomyces polynesiensis TaxID=1325934 RepID=UPI000A7EAC70|nr:hypothetical protein [Actinomyces polynesiensis]